MSKTRVLIEINGGLVQSVAANAYVEVIVIDYDNPSVHVDSLDFILTDEKINRIVNDEQYRVDEILSKYGGK